MKTFIFAGMSAPTKTDVVDIAIEFVGSKKYEYIGTIAGAASQSEGKSRILAFLQKAQTSEQTKGLYLQVDAKYMIANEHQQNNNENRPNADLKFKLTYALDNTMELATLRGNVQLKQSPQLREEVRRNVNQQAGNRIHTVDHIDVELDVSDVPEGVLEKQLSLNVADVYKYIRYATFQYLNEDNEYKGQQNKMAIEVRLLNDLSSASITMKAANLKSQWNEVPLPKMWRNLIAVPSTQSSYNLIEEVTRNAIQYQDTCQIRSNQINTFVNATIENVDYDNTWHVAVQHVQPNRDESDKWIQQNQEVTEKPNGYVAIAVRNTENNNNNEDNENQEWPRKNQNNHNKNIEVAIILRQNANNEVVLNLRPANQQSNNAPLLSVNGKQQQLSASKVQNIYSNENQREWLARVYIVKQNTLDQSNVDIKVETAIGNYQVTYNGKQVQIHRDSFFRGNQGICGAHTGQWYNELKSPQNQLLHNKMEFVASWALIEDGQTHSALKRAQQKVRNIAHSSEEIIYSYPVPNSKRAQNPWNQQQNENQNQNENQQEQQSWNQNGSQSGTKHQTQYVEDQQKGRICFSKRPLPVCATGTKANGKYTQTVQVYCRDINDPAAKQYKSQIQRGRKLDMSAHPSNDQLKFTVPKRCEQISY